MKISLVQAPRWSIHTPAYAVALLTGNLRSQGHEVFPKCYDPRFYRGLGEEHKLLWLDESADFWNYQDNVRKLIADNDALMDTLIDDLLDDEPDVVGFSVKLWSEVFSLEMAQRIKARRRDVYVMFGGPQMSQHDPNTFFQRYADVDAICRQEADISLPRFLRGLEQNHMRPQPEPGFAYRAPDGTVVDCGLIKEIPDVKAIPFADYSSIDLNEFLDRRGVTMVMSRGCINRCTYCSEAPAFLRFRYHPPERVLEEMLHHWNTAGTTRPMRIHLNDSLINGNMKQLVRLAELLIENRDKIQVEYGGMMFIRDELLDPTVVDKLVASGLKDTLFGLETGSEAVLKQMKKRFKHSTAERVFELFHERKVTVVATGIFGYPVESEAEYHKTLDFFRRNAKNIDVFLLNYLGLHGDCELTRHPEKYGIIRTSNAPNDWIADEGRNTYELRLQRTNIARALLGQKVADIGGFMIDQAQYYDVASPWKDRVRELEARVADLEQQVAERDTMRKESLRVRNYVKPKRGSQPIGWLDTVQPSEDGWVARGWALDPDRTLPAREVIVVNQHGRVVSYSRVKVARPDVREALAHDDFLHSGWEAPIDPTDLDEGENILRAFVYQPDSELAYPLQGEAAVSS